MAKITGTKFDDLLIGTNSADVIYGYGGDDVLEGGPGNDKLYGGAGNDTLRAFSWGEEPPAARDGTQINKNEPIADNDYLIGGGGNDTFEIRWLIDGKDEIIEKHRDPDSGYVDYNAKTGGVAGENNNVHDHWVETQGIGTKTIVDFNKNEDKLLLHGHTVNLKSLSYRNGDTILKFYSVQGVNGAHRYDDVGTVVVKNAHLNKSDINVNPGVFFGVETAEFQGSTGSGLDRIVDFITSDPHLNQFSNSPTDEVVEGAAAADRMNQILVKTIKATAAADDGVISTAEVRDFTDYIRDNHYNEWVQLHGDDAPETGFHLVRGDPQVTRYAGVKAIDTLADGIYHIPFGYHYKYIRNEDGNPTATKVQDVARWLNDLLEKDLADGTLKSGTGAPSSGGGTTDSGGGGSTDSGDGGGSATGLDQLVEKILNDPYLNQTLKSSQIKAGAAAAQGLNDLLEEGIQETGIADNGKINAADVRELDDWMKDNHYSELVNLHGDDPAKGFHIVRGPSYHSSAKLFGENAIFTVADSVYHVGFGSRYAYMKNQDGNATATRVEDVAGWMDDLLSDDLAGHDLHNHNFDLYDVEDRTGTGLDKIVDTIYSDRGLNLKIKSSEIDGGAEAANGLNQILIEAIMATDAADSGRITANEVRDLGNYVRNKHFSEWVNLHGDDENGEETGFHLVQNDGATSRLYGKNAVDTVADGIYHIAFKPHYNQLRNEDGNATASTLQDAADWLNKLLSEDLDDGSLMA